MCLLLLLLQTTARRNGIPIDSLVFEHGVVNLDEREINGPPKEGVYVKGLFLEGEGGLLRAWQRAVTAATAGACAMPAYATGSNTLLTLTHTRWE